VTIKKGLPWLGLAVASLWLAAPLFPRAAPPVTRRVDGSRGRFPVRFEANDGQLDARVRYLARAPGLAISLTDDGATMALGATRTPVTMRVRGAPASPRPEADGVLTGRSSYFIGNDRSRWRTDVPSFARVTYRGVAPGVDEVFHGEAGALEYDFIVAPGVRPESVEIAFDGADHVAIDARGALRVEAGGGVLVQPSPRVYQRSDGQELAVAGGYRVTGPTTVAFEVGAYDHARALVIDPVLAYSSYLGGAGSDFGYGVALDASGAIYVTGFTSSANFPTRDAYQATLDGNDDVFVAKLDPTGTVLVYATYIGGSGNASGYGIAVDPTGAAYVTGSTDSADFPTEGPIQAAPGGSLDAFVLKLTPSGSMLAYSTFLGGAAADSAYGVAVDSGGEAFVAGTTRSSDFPTASPSQAAFGGVADAFVAELDASGHALVYSTYLGGSADDEGRGVAIDATGAAYVTGFTSSLDFPMAAGTTPFQALNNGNENVFVAKLAPSDTSLAYATYLGGSEVDLGRAIAVDDAGAAYVTGNAASADFPTKSAFQPTSASNGSSTNAFVTKLDPKGATLTYSTYLGGTGGDFGESIAVDGKGHAFVAGYTGSTDFPTEDATQPTNGASGTAGGTNAFVAEVASTGSTLVYSTYLGGSVGDSAEAIAVGPSGDAYVAGYTVSPDFPTVEPEQAHLASHAGDNAFVAVFAGGSLSGDAGVPDASRAAFDAGQGAAATFDAASVYDAAEPSPPDATPSIVSASGDGCSCRVGASSATTTSPTGALWMTSLLGALLSQRRRKRVAVAFDRDLP
jgi:MYXO-CTERM domain-containing protein